MLKQLKKWQEKEMDAPTDLLRISTKDFECNHIATESWRQGFIRLEKKVVASFSKCK